MKLKIVFILCVAIAAMQHIQAFKVVTIHKGAPPSVDAAPVAAAPAPALDPGALLQGVQSAIAGKVQQVQALVGSLIQQKTALKQNALNSIQSTIGAVKSQIGTLAGSIPKPLVIRKHVYIGGAGPAAAPAPVAPDCTTSLDADVTKSGYN